MTNINLSTIEHTLQGKSILLVEDDEFIARVYEKYLGHTGAHIFTARNGALGLEELNKHTVDIILLDLGMPGMNGIDMLRKIRENPKTAGIPVIILSNTTMTEARNGFMEITEAGVIDIIKKYDTPLNEVLRRIKSCFPETI